MYQKRSTKRGNYRSVSSLCPNCFSTLVTNEKGAIGCSGDRIKSWQAEFDTFKSLSDKEKERYLAKLDNPARFLELAGTLNNNSCGFSNKLNHVAPNYSVRIPDPMAVARIERQLKRPLTEEELYEGHSLQVDGLTITVPHINFPDDV